MVKPSLKENEFLFCDDRTYPNKLLYFVFNTYILKGTLNYFNHVQNNVFFIKENTKLPEDVINQLKNYEHLVSFTEVDNIENEL